ncbi:hypothetical protein H920_02234 [Fukomys damarensis]|uniref:Uncharacterized protein n=1 Tax=Fukomys damarensis TaxID=885580 RepID=A0A091E1F3_FUKDA|nr:hypothetical protein H920_02234 [Fukomys damarensis]
MSFAGLGSLLIEAEQGEGGTEPESTFCAAQCLRQWWTTTQALKDAGGLGNHFASSSPLPSPGTADEQGAARSPELGDVELGGVARSVRMRKRTSLGKVRICALARVDGRKNRALSGAVKEEDVFPDCLLLVFETQD